MSAPLKLYELAGASDTVRFSPYCWRVRLALAHKGLAVETLPWRFTEKEAIAPSGQGKVPVLVDGERWLHDSWSIAEYLEDTHPDRPSLFGGAVGRALARFIAQWTDTTLQPALARVVAPGVFATLHDKDREYYRRTREAAFGMTLEDLAAQRDDALARLPPVLKPLRQTLAAQPYLAGTAPNYADYAAFSAFQWARVASPVALVAADDPLAPWVERMLDAHDGLARATPAAAS